VKGNLSARAPALGYELREGQFGWTGESPLTAALLLEPDRGPSKQDKAESFLRGALANGPRLSRDVLEEGLEAGVSERTLERAKSSLGIQSYSEGKKGKGGADAWYLRLPLEAPPPGKTPGKTPGKMARQRGSLKAGQIRRAAAREHA